MDAGTTFLLGEVTQSLCCPSRASILTGQYTTTHGVTNNTGSDLDDSSTIATWLDDAGYRTGLVGKYLNGYGTGTLENYIPPGWDSWHSFHGAGGGRGIYDDYPWINWEAGDAEAEITQYVDADSLSGEACAEDNFYSTDLICRQALDFLAADTQSPFFLYVAPVAPHSPRTPADRHVGAFSAFTPAVYPDYDQIPSPNPPSYLSTVPLKSNHFEFITKQLRGAVESVLAVDDLIGELHAQLESSGQLANTVWVFISDNGFAAGEHRLSNKQCEYLACHRVPFVVACPTGVCAGTVPGAVDGDNYALNIDIAPTLADLAGATPTLAVDGRSLVPILEDPSAAWRTEWFLREQTPTMDGIVGEASDGHTYKYVAIDTGETEMYDLDSDPWELINLAGDPAYATIESDLVARLDAHING
jgi:arylsulfatase A-like enzyme